MTFWYSTPHSQFMNQPRSYWIPLRIIFYTTAQIITVVKKANMKIGNRWTGYDVTSERVD